MPQGCTIDGFKRSHYDKIPRAKSLSKGCDIKFIINVYDIFNLCRFDSGEVHTKQRFKSV